MKKEYKKPQVVEVKLTLSNPILGLCNDLSPLVDMTACNFSGAPCAQP
jgi:hypothetical protein